MSVVEGYRSLVGRCNLCNRLVALWHFEACPYCDTYDVDVLMPSSQVSDEDLVDLINYVLQDISEESGRLEGALMELTTKKEGQAT